MEFPCVSLDALHSHGILKGTWDTEGNSVWGRDTAVETETYGPMYLMASLKGS